MTLLRRSIVLTLAGSLATFGAACGDDSGTSGGEESSSSGGVATGDSGATSAPGSSSGGNVTMTGGGSGGSGDTAGTTDPTGATGDDTAGTTQGDSTSEGETESVVCADLGMEACMTTEGCMGIGGRELRMTDTGACWGPREFVECQMAMGCGDAITYACPPDDKTLWEFSDTCTPEGWVACGPPPPIEIPPCAMD